MKHRRLRFSESFRVIRGNRRAQAAAMAIPPGVLAGKGLAVVDGRRLNLAAGSLLFIERGERHEIRNTGRALLRTLNFYAPPAYGKRGRELPRGRK